MDFAVSQRSDYIVSVSHKPPQIGAVRLEDFKSYGQSDLGKPASVTQTDQKDSKFEIISIQKRKSDYLLEAKFNLIVFDDNKQMQKIENGYLRFSVLNIY